MNLTPDEATRAYHELMEALRSNGFDWVAFQVEEKVVFGKPRLRKIRVPSSAASEENFLEFAAPRRVARKSEEFAVSESFSPQERLEVLLDAIELAIPRTIEVGEETLRSLGDYDAGSLIIFEPEADVKEPVRLSLGELEERKLAGERLLELIEELREGEQIANSAGPVS